MKIVVFDVFYTHSAFSALLEGGGGPDPPLALPFPLRICARAHGIAFASCWAWECGCSRRPRLRAMHRGLGPSRHSWAPSASSHGLPGRQPALLSGWLFGCAGGGPPAPPRLRAMLIRPRLPAPRHLSSPPPHVARLWLRRHLCHRIENPSIATVAVNPSLISSLSSPSSSSSLCQPFQKIRIQG